MQLTPTIYNQYKLVANEAYMDMYHAILQAIQENQFKADEEPDMEEQEALARDIMLSNVLGTVTSFDHVHTLIKRDSSVDIIQELEKIRDQIEDDRYTADNIQALINKLK